jgi:MFS family permease
MNLNTHEKRTYLFLIVLTVFTTIAFQLWRTLFNNFSVESIGLDSDSVGLIQTIREVPGFMAFTAVYVILVIKEKWLAFVAVLIMSFGVAITGFFPTKWGLVGTTLLMSVGFHYFETINQSLSLQYFSKNNFTLATANIRKYGALAAIFSGIIISLLIPRLDYKTLYLIFGALGVAGTFLALKFLPDETKVPAQEKKLVIKKEYWLYYALTFLNGSRRQIFTVFALFLLVKRHDMSASTISILFVANNVINFFIYPIVAKLINKWGEKQALKFEYISLILVFSMYALIDYPWMAILLYFLDNICFSFSIATRSYFQKIAKPSDMAPTAGVSFTINHIAAVIIPVLGGYLWLVDWRIPFIMGVGFACCSLFLTRFIRVPKQLAN